MGTSLDRYHVKSFELGEPLSELFISKVALATVSGLKFMRELRLMHRDVKPSNMLINYAGEIKLCDFGLSGLAVESCCSTNNGTKVYVAVMSLLFDLTSLSLFAINHQIIIYLLNLAREGRL